MKKQVFTFLPNSIIDIITNSSSELFTFNGKTKEIVIEMIKSIYPDYLSEYEELKHISELSNSEINTYLDYACSSRVWPAKKSDYPILNGFTFDELYQPKIRNGVVDIAWNNEIQYELRDNRLINDITPNNYWDSQFITVENRVEILKKLDPDGTLFFLFSKDENPNWEMQKLLMQFGERYHLG